jgi:pheromone shutdown protein TraB
MRIFGTSHVSQESVDEIEHLILEHEPDIVAVELDPMRLKALLTGEKGSGGSLFVRLLEKFQSVVGSKTGVMPGSEMKKAYETAGEVGAEVALIDQDIRITFGRLKHVSRKEKVRAALQLGLAMLIGGKKDLWEVPDEDAIQEMLEEMESQFPGLYQVLVEERNLHMLEALRHLEDENPESEILVFVGAGHSRYLKDELEA